MASTLKDAAGDLNIKVKDFTVSGSKGVKSGKRKREDPDERKEEAKRRREEYNELIHELLIERVLALEKQKKVEEAKRKKKETKEPSPKQQAQWAKFREKVAKAKQLYEERGVKGADNWAQCMKEVAKGKVDEMVLSDAEISQLVDMAVPPNQEGLE